MKLEVNIEMEIPKERLRVALIGAGQRAWTIYRPLFSSLKPWIDVVAVCDTVALNAQRMGEALGAPTFNDVRALVKAKLMEAALVVAPVDAHYPMSMYLSANGIHNLVETPWCSTISQGREMIRVARENGVIVRVGENFFRFPIDRMVKQIANSGFLGPIRRVVSYADHTGYHNNSRWIAFAGSYPTWVQALQHTIPTVRFRSTPQRTHSTETYVARSYMFPDNLLVVDHAANIKGFLGRLSRPGHTEWQGDAGTVIYRAVRSWDGAAEVRYLQEIDRDATQADVDHTHPLAVFPIVDEFDEATWLCSYVDLPAGRVKYVNPFRPVEPSVHIHPWYGSPVMNHIVDFALAVKGTAKSEFDENDALMSLVMEVGAKASAKEGRRISLSLEEEYEEDGEIASQLHARYGVDALDWEAMLAIGYAKT